MQLLRRKWWMGDPHSSSPPSPFPLYLHSLLFAFPYLPLEVKSSLRGLRKRCKLRLPQGVWGRAPPEIQFGAF